MMKRITLTLLISLMLPGLVFAQAKKTSAGRSDLLVSTDWLAKNASNPKVILIYVGRDNKDYVAGHIPNARFLALTDLVTTRDGKPNEMPPVEKLKTVFAGLGVNNDSRIVLYSDNYNLFAARAYFTLDYLGLGDQAALLDGGLDKWKAEKRQLSTETPELKTGNFSPRLKPNVLMVRDIVRDVSWATSNLEKPNYALIDARPNAEYTGATPGDGVKRGGHIPGSANVFWMEKNLVSKENPVLRPVTELRKLYEAAGATKDKTVVSYCRTGVQASHTYFVAKYLGYDVAMYDGSFLEWSNAENTSVSTGDKVK
ncbi:MAG: sulfurtransferase [Acidobacteria bacterium]|nr:sulfurtransferase [Acidobacteriota bacterium]